MTEPKISVVLCTWNRASLLEKVLESLRCQTLPNNEFEVIIIDDGSTDRTQEIVSSFRDRLFLRYFFQENSGLGAARNYGIKMCNAPIIVFKDDDDLAGPDLLKEHLLTHGKYPEENYAVLGYTKLDRNIAKKPLMYFVTEVGLHLFSYPLIKDGEVLDFNYFWGGCSSCKKSFLIKYGMFNPVFRFGCEDDELGYRLSKHGLKVVYNKQAMSTMVREISYEDFLLRVVKQGQSKFMFSTLHNIPEVKKLTNVLAAKEKWALIEPSYDNIVKSAAVLDKIANKKMEFGFGIDRTLRYLLHQAYSIAFSASELKGVMSH
ncbi:MAG: glycosyltransferase family 2 protein [Nitrospinales bacterium]